MLRLKKYCSHTRIRKGDLRKMIPTWKFDGMGKAKWLLVGNSLYGAVISGLLATGSVGQGLLVTLPCIAVGGVQGTILYNLWWSLPPPLYQNNDDSPVFCSLNSRLLFFQAYIIGVFIVFLGSSFAEILNDEYLIVRSANIGFGCYRLISMSYIQDYRSRYCFVRDCDLGRCVIGWYSRSLY